MTPAQLLEAIAKSALAGADRRPLPEAAVRNLEELGFDPDATPGLMLLNGLAWTRQLNRHLPPLSTAVPVEVPEYPAASTLHDSGATLPRLLRRALAGDFPEVLREYVLRSRQYRLALPSEVLPEIFDRCLEDPELWKEVRPLLRPQGLWLAGQHPEWVTLTGVTDRAFRESRIPEQRLLYFRGRRATEPAAALADLTPSWNEETPNSKLAFLAEIRHTLQPSDQPFLQQALADGRQEVRLMAAKLLCKLPDPAYIEALLLAVEDHIQWDPDRGLIIEPPRTPLPGWSALGLSFRTTKTTREHTHREWIARFLALIPPGRWETRFQCSHPDCWQAVERSPDFSLLLPALGEAALLHLDEPWLESIVRYWLRTEAGGWDEPLGHRILRKLPAGTFQKLCTAELERTNGVVESGSPLGFLLLHHRAFWEDRLSLLFVQGFQQQFHHSGTTYWELRHYWDLLATAAYRVNPDLMDRLRSGWDYQSPWWSSWQKIVEKFLQTLHFRKRMREAFAKTASGRAGK